MLDEFLLKVKSLRDTFDADYKSAGADNAESMRVKYLAKKGPMQELFDAMRTISPQDKPQAGKSLNELRQYLESQIESLLQAAADSSITRSLSTRAVDIHLPAEGSGAGSLHPVSLMLSELLREFRKMGFYVADGPEIDHDFFNFSALNFPDDHPARDMQDTFFVAGHDHTVLRTHTSNVQIHEMLSNKPPLKFVAPGRTFRCDSDPTHTPMFHQIEAVVVDRGISFSNMKGVIDSFLKSIYGRDLKTRLRPSFFPFVEPGAEVDLQCVACRGKGCGLCKHTGWLEIGGCGMIHPNVFESVGYDSEEWTGFAFGFGIDRMAMLKYNLPDLRTLFASQTNFLAQFHSIRTN